MKAILGEGYPKEKLTETAKVSDFFFFLTTPGYHALMKEKALRAKKKQFL